MYQQKKPWEEDWSQQSQGIPVSPPDPRLPLQLQQDRGQAAAAPYAGPKAAADTQRAQAEAEYARQREAASVEQSRTSAASNRTQIQNTAFDNERNLAKEFSARPEVQAFTTIAPQYDAALRAAKIDDKAADLNLVNAYAKILDPGSVVREGEVQMASDVGGPGEQVKGYLNQINGGARLTPEQRRQIVGQVRVRASAAADLYRQSREQYTNLAQNHGIDPLRIVGESPAKPYQQMEADFFGHPIKNGNGLVQPHGQRQGAQPSGPYDPTGSGDIGFNQSAQGLPPQAQAAQRDLQAKILGGAFHSPEEFIGYAKKTYGFDINPEQAKAGIEAVRKGGAVQINTPQFAPQLSDARGTPQADQSLALQQRILSGLPGGGALMGAGQMFGPQKVDAFTRGVADVPTMGMSEELLSGFDPAKLAQQNAIRDYDKEHNAGARFSGQLLGGFALPTGIPGAARGAGMDAIRAGGSRAEALLAATKAGSLRAGREGALYSGAYGVGSTDGGPLERLSGGAVDASIGAGTGYLGGRIFGGLFGRNGNRRATSAGAANLPPLIDPATGSLNQPLESANPAQRMAAARQYGIDLPLDSAGNKGSAIVGKGLDIMPASAGLMNDSRRATHGQTEDAVLNLANRYGAAGTMDAAGGALQTGAKNWIGRFDQVSSKAYDAIPIHPSASASLDNTRNALSGMLNVFQSNSKMKEIFQNGTLKSYLHALDEQPNIDSELGQTDPLAGVLRTLGRSTDAGAGELSWQDLKHFRSIIGEQIGDQRFSDSPLKSQMRGLYGALSEDMRTTAAARGPRALRAFERANSLYAQGQDRIEGALVRILGDNSKNNPEAAAAAIQTIARDGRGSSNIQQLTAIRNSLRKGNEWNEVASTLIRLGGQPANSQGREFDPSTFIRTYADMSEPARNLLFGDGGRQDLRKALDGFVAVTQRLNNTNALRNTSQTAPGFIGAGVVATVGQQLATTAAHPVQSLMTLLGTAGGAGVNYGMAKAWTNPKFVNWATGYTKMMASGRATPAAQDAWARRLGGIAKSEPAIANDVLSIQQRITDALGSTYSRAAASSQEEERRKRQQPY